jgi:DNA-binding CsgD family transcriptional regulator
MPTVPTPAGPHSASPTELHERVKADRQGEPYLVFRDGGGTQCILTLGGTEIRCTVGRATTAELCLSWDDQVSRVHAELERLSGDWTVVDNGLSRNGTWVNGERVEGRRRLSGGDVMRFGATQVVFRAPNPQLLETADAGHSPPRPTLSEAQRRVLVALCRPCRAGAMRAAPATNRQIADELFLSVEGVKSHLRALFERFEVEDLPQNSKRARLVELAFDSGAVHDRDLQR